MTRVRVPDARVDDAFVSGYRSATVEEVAVAEEAAARVGFPVDGRVSLPDLAAAVAPGLRLVPVRADRWPLRDVSACADAPVLLPGDVTLHVAQLDVSAVRVRERAGLRPVGVYAHDGWVGSLSVGVLDGNLFVFDGHHALAARLLLGWPLAGWLYDGVPGGPQRLGVPRLR